VDEQHAPPRRALQRCPEQLELARAADETTLPRLAQGRPERRRRPEVTHVAQLKLLGAILDPPLAADNRGRL
jgi:hypothetical protein